MSSRVLAEVLSLVAPPVCVACRVPLVAASEVLCAGCRRALPWLRGDRCERCALPAPCGPCPATRAAYSAAWAPVAYDGVARTLVSALKFRGALALADLMAAQMAAGAPAGMLESAALVPVPGHRSRRRKRGFDPAGQLATALAQRTGLPLAHCLERAGTPRAQLGASRRTRVAPGRIEIRVRGAPPERAVLVDDVHTTGATLDACARALRAAGTDHVVCVSYARTLRG